MLEVFNFILSLYYKSYVGPVKFLTVCMMRLDKGAKLPFELWFFDYVEGELNCPIYYILCLQVGWVKNSLLNGSFYGWTLFGWFLEFGPKWALELDWWIVKLTTGLRDFRLAQVLVPVRSISWVVTINILNLLNLSNCEIYRVSLIWLLIQ